MKLYKTFKKLSKWFGYQAIYLEMEYHLKQVMKGKKDKYLKRIYSYDRGIGKSVSLARLSAKYNIPIITATCACKEWIEKAIPEQLPQYFRFRKPIAISENTILPDMRFKVILVEEGLTKDPIVLANIYSHGKVVGYKFIG